MNVPTNNEIAAALWGTAGRDAIAAAMKAIETGAFGKVAEYQKTAELCFKHELAIRALPSP